MQKKARSCTFGLVCGAASLLAGCQGGDTSEKQPAVLPPASKMHNGDSMLVTVTAFAIVVKRFDDTRQ